MSYDPFPGPGGSQGPYQQGFRQAYPPDYGGGGAPFGYPETSHAVLALVLGIVGLLGLTVLSPFAWALGGGEVRGVDAGRRDPRGRGMGSAGRILGIIGTVVLVLQLVALAAFVLGFFTLGGADALRNVPTGASAPGPSSVESRPETQPGTRPAAPPKQRGGTAAIAAPRSVPCGTVTVASSATCSVTVRSTGTAALVVYSTELTGPNSKDFTVVQGCTGTVRATCTLRISFTPAGSGARSAVLTVHQNLPDPDTGTRITLTGTGTGTGPVVSPGPSGGGGGNTAGKPHLTVHLQYACDPDGSGGGHCSQVVVSNDPASDRDYHWAYAADRSTNISSVTPVQSGVLAPGESVTLTVDLTGCPARFTLVDSGPGSTGLVNSKDFCTSGESG